MGRLDKNSNQIEKGSQNLSTSPVDSAILKYFYPLLFLSLQTKTRSYFNQLVLSDYRVDFSFFDGRNFRQWFFFYLDRFTHLHVHSNVAIFYGGWNIGHMFKKAVDHKMPAIALTTMATCSVFKFVAEAEKYNIIGQPPVIKPIVGCEFYMVEDRHKKQFTREQKAISAFISCCWQK